MHVAQMKPTIAGKKLIKQHYYRIVPLALDYYDNINNTDRRLLSDIYTMYIEGHLFYKSNRVLAKEMNISRRSITRCVKKVSDLGFISTHYARNNTRYIYLSDKNLQKLVIKQTTTNNKKKQVQHNKPNMKNVPKVVRDNLRQNQSPKTRDLANRVLHQENVKNARDTKKIMANLNNEPEPQRSIDKKIIDELHQGSALSAKQNQKSTYNKGKQMNTTSKNTNIDDNDNDTNNTFTVNKVMKPTLGEQNLMNQKYASEHHGHIKLRAPLPKGMHSVGSILKGHLNKINNNQSHPSLSTYDSNLAKELNDEPLTKFNEYMDKCSMFAKVMYTTARILACLGFKDKEEKLGNIFDNKHMHQCTITHQLTNPRRLNMAVKAMKYRQLSYYLNPNNKYYHKVVNPLKSIMYNYSPKRNTEKLEKYYYNQWKKLQSPKH